MKSVFTLLLASIIYLGYAQEEQTEKKKWTSEGIASLSYSQTNFSDWAAGGTNSYAINGLVNYELKWKNENSTFENYLNFGYGVIDNASDGLRKGEDKIDISSKYGYKAANKWYYSGLLNIRSQFDAGYNYVSNGQDELISNFFAPGYINLSLGMEYKPNDEFFLMLSLTSAKITIVTDDSLATRYGVDEGENIRTEAGGMVRVQYNKPNIVKNVSLQTKLELFSNYVEEPGNVDIIWETLISMKINEYLSATFTANVIYDHDILPGFQYKQILGAGLAYRF